MNGTSFFAHSVNRNGTYNSICRGCFATVACVGNEAELAQHEDDHVCDPPRLYQLKEDPLFHSTLACWLRDISSVNYDNKNS
jgi:hypothetical protein